MTRLSSRRSVLALAATATAALGLRDRAVASGTGHHEPTISQTEGTSVVQPSREDMQQLWSQWSDLWNGDLAIANQIIAPSFVAHFAPAGNTTPENVHGPDGVAGWISQSFAAYSTYSVTTIVGPIIDGNMMAGRWTISGTHQGKAAGAIPPTPAAGNDVFFDGTDMLRVEGGQLVEYWVSSDTLSLLQQIGAIPS